MIQLVSVLYQSIIVPTILNSGILAKYVHFTTNIIICILHYTVQLENCTAMTKADTLAVLKQQLTSK